MEESQAAARAGGGGGENTINTLQTSLKSNSLCLCERFKHVEPHIFQPVSHQTLLCKFQHNIIIRRLVHDEEFDFLMSCGLAGCGTAVFH